MDWGFLIQTSQDSADTTWQETNPAAAVLCIVWETQTDNLSSRLLFILRSKVLFCFFKWFKLTKSLMITRKGSSHIYIFLFCCHFLKSLGLVYISSLLDTVLVSVVRSRLQHSCFALVWSSLALRITRATLLTGIRSNWVAVAATSATPTAVVASTSRAS